MLIDGGQGRNTVALITVICQSAVTGAALKPPLDPDNPFYQREMFLQRTVRFHEKSTFVERVQENGITTSGNDADAVK